MKVKAYVPYTLPVVFDAPEGATEEELTELAYDAANRMMREEPFEACMAMFSEGDPEFEDAEGE